MKILLFGSRGFIGQRLLTVFPDARTPSCNIADRNSVSAFLDEYKPDVVINCAGKTGRPNVDWCEDHRLETVEANVTGPLVLLKECMDRGIYLVHMSTGCIYEGGSESIYKEEDVPNFFGSFYSRTKNWSDQILSEFPILQLRMRMPFDDQHHERNLITKLVNYSSVLDAPNSLTYIPDFLKAAKHLIEHKMTGTFNVVCPGHASPYRIMEMYRDLVDADHTFGKLTVDALPTVARAARSNCVLSCKKLEQAGVQLTPVEVALEQAICKCGKAPLKSEKKAKAVVGGTVN